jgi:hypothetical protein
MPSHATSFKIRNYNEVGQNKFALRRRQLDKVKRILQPV